MVYWHWKQHHAVSWSLTDDWLQIKHAVVKSSMLSVTTAGHPALLTPIILLIPSSITPYKCHAGSSHRYSAIAWNTHAWSSLGRSPLPIKWHYFRKVLCFTLPTSMVNTVIQQLPHYYFFSTKKKKIRENVSKIVNLTFSSGILFPASAKIQLSEVALSVSVQLYQQLLTSGSHYPCLGSILAFVRPLWGSTFGSVRLEMGRACPIVSQLQARVCLSGPLFCLPALSAQRNHIVIRKIIINCYI